MMKSTDENKSQHLHPLLSWGILLGTVCTIFITFGLRQDMPRYIFAGIACPVGVIIIYAIKYLIGTKPVKGFIKAHKLALSLVSVGILIVGAFFSFYTPTEYFNRTSKPAIKAKDKIEIYSILFRELLNKQHISTNVICILSIGKDTNGFDLVVPPIEVMSGLSNLHLNLQTWSDLCDNLSNSYHKTTSELRSRLPEITPYDLIDSTSYKKSETRYVLFSVELLKWINCNEVEVAIHMYAGPRTGYGAEAKIIKEEGKWKQKEPYRYNTCIR